MVQQPSFLDCSGHFCRRIRIDHLGKDPPHHRRPLRRDADDHVRHPEPGRGSCRHRLQHHRTAGRHDDHRLRAQSDRSVQLSGDHRRPAGPGASSLAAGHAGGADGSLFRLSGQCNHRPADRTGHVQNDLSIESQSPALHHLANHRLEHRRRGDPDRGPPPTS